MKIELGKTKIRGFRFTNGIQGCLFLDEMNNYIGKEGVIVKIIHDWLGEKVRVKFDDYACDYPSEMAKDYIVKQEEDFEFNFTLDEPIVKSPFPIPNQYTKEDLIPNFLIGGYTSQNQNEVNRKMSESCKRIAEEINRIVTKHQNRNNMKNLKITAPDGYEIDKEKSTFENIVFKPIKKELPKSWEELDKISGYYINDVDCVPIGINKCNHTGREINIFATKEQAEASLALAQLSQLLKVYRADEKEIDWTDRHTKYCIEIRCGKAIINVRQETHHFLSFYSEDTCKLFLENFRDLIEQAKPLMS